MTKILFICHGNICRSPAAELILRAMLNRAGLSEEYYVSSAATSAEEIGNPIYPPMRVLLEAKGLDCTENHARRVCKSDYDLYDLIIAMDRENLWDLRMLFHGDPDSKLHLLLEFVGRDEEISDPWYTHDFSGSLTEIEQGSAGILETLCGVIFLDFSSCADIPSLYSELRNKMDWEKWYGENLDALHDILTGLPHRGKRFIITLPSEAAPDEVRLYCSRILSVFQESEEVILL